MASRLTSGSCIPGSLPDLRRPVTHRSSDYGEDTYLEAIQKYLSLVVERLENNHDEKFKDLLDKLKQHAVNNDDQEQAKRIWCYEKTLFIQETYVSAFSAMKKHEYYSAWCLLEQAEIALRHLERHFQRDGYDYKLWFTHKHIRQFQSLFPYKLFSSPAYIKKKVLCSICKQEISIRKSCGHIAGEIYNGEMCGREIIEAELIEISLTPNPANKYTVAFPVNPNTNEKIDEYDYSLIQYVISGLRAPFDGWDIEWTKTRHPHSKFHKLNVTDDCPCGSSKQYKDCCLLEDGVLKPHVNIYFWKEPPEDLPKFSYNY